MSSALYSRDILRLATSIRHQGRLASPDASADRRSPTCGSRVIADVRLDDRGRIGELALEVSACALGQASAALVSAHAIGRTASELLAAADTLRHYLVDPAVIAHPDFWPGIEVFQAARDYPARHPSILLAFEAVSEAALLAEQTRAKRQTGAP